MLLRRLPLKNISRVSVSKAKSIEAYLSNQCFSRRRRLENPQKKVIFSDVRDLLRNQYLIRSVLQTANKFGRSPKGFPTDTTCSRNIMFQKCGGICGLWVLNEIIKEMYAENMKKIVGAVWKLPAK